MYKVQPELSQSLPGSLQYSQHWSYRPNYPPSLECELTVHCSSNHRWTPHRDRIKK